MLPQSRAENINFGEPPVTPMRAAYSITINGVPYQVAVADIPHPAKVGFNVSWGYVAPASSIYVVLES